MSPRGRVFFLVTLAAVVASGVVVLGVLATRSHVAAAAKPRAGLPAARARPRLAHRSARRARFSRPSSSTKTSRPRKRGRSSAATARSKRRSARRSRAGPTAPIEALQALAADHPRSSLLALHLGLALYWTRPRRRGRDRLAGSERGSSPTRIRGARERPPAPSVRARPARFVPSFATPLAIRVLPPARKLAALRRGRRARRRAREDPLRHRAAAARPPALGRAASSPPQRASHQTIRRTRRRRGRPLRQGRPVARLQPARPARARLPARPDRPLPSRPDAASGRRRSRPPGSSSAGRARGTAIAPGHAGRGLPRPRFAALGPADRN